MKTIVTMVLMTCALAASAQGIPQNAWIDASRSVLSRAEVLAELQRSRASGEFEALQAEAYAFGTAVRDTGHAERPLTRAQVVAELQRSRLSGEFEALNAEAYPHVRQLLPTRLAALDPARVPQPDRGAR